MNNEEAWAETEYEYRLSDIDAAKRKEITLSEAKARAHDRRRMAGFTEGKAASLLGAHIAKIRLWK